MNGKVHIKMYVNLRIFTLDPAPGLAQREWINLPLNSSPRRPVFPSPTAWSGNIKALSYQYREETVFSFQLVE
jgi:hypothetical protein